MEDQRTERGRRELRQVVNEFQATLARYVVAFIPKCPQFHIFQLSDYERTCVQLHWRRNAL